MNTNKSTQSEPTLVDETQTMIVSSHVLIRDKHTGQVLVNKRGS